MKIKRKGNVNKEFIFKTIVRIICEVIPELEGHAFQTDDRLADLGANSIDRAEIVTMTLEVLSLTTLHEAWDEAKLDGVDADRVGLVVGGSNLGQRELIQVHKTYAERGPCGVGHGYRWESQS